MYCLSVGIRKFLVEIIAWLKSLDRLGIMLGDGKVAFGRRRSADAANREAYEEYSRHYCSGDGGHAGCRSRT